MSSEMDKILATIAKLLEGNASPNLNEVHSDGHDEAHNSSDAEDGADENKDDGQTGDKSFSKLISTPRMGKKKACRECGKSVRHLRRHIQSLHMEKSFQCEDCGHLFALKPQLKMHMARIHGELKFSCSFCKMMFKTEVDRKYHENHHNNPSKNVQCPHCKQSFFSHRNQRIHVEKKVCLKKMKQSLFLQSSAAPDAESA